MLTSCPKCERRLRSEQGSLGVFRMVVFFDDEEGSDTYAQQVDRCAGCGLWLHAFAMNSSVVAPRR